MLQEKLDAYQCTSQHEEENALKEICQELLLAGLSRSGFFEHAAFQGGTCLRVFHKLPRFSEDLDFMLQQSSTSFQIKPYLELALEEISSLGLAFELVDRSKTEKNIQTAFLKTDSYGKILVLKNPLHKKSAKKIVIKIEVDSHPPLGSGYEVRFLDFPFLCPVTLQDSASLFSGKIHALLCRGYMKGRDWYDFLWYVSKKIPYNEMFLSAALFQYGPWKDLSFEMTPDWVKKELRRKIGEIDWQEARADASRFLSVRDQASLTSWTADFFFYWVEKMFVR